MKTKNKKYIYIKKKAAFAYYAKKVSFYILIIKLYYNFILTRNSKIPILKTSFLSQKSGTSDFNTET